MNKIWNMPSILLVQWAMWTWMCVRVCVCLCVWMQAFIGAKTLTLVRYYNIILSSIYRIIIIHLKSFYCAATQFRDRTQSRSNSKLKFRTLTSDSMIDSYDYHDDCRYNYCCDIVWFCNCVKLNCEYIWIYILISIYILNILKNKNCKWKSIVIQLNYPSIHPLHQLNAF